MADISKIDNGTEYNLKDATARAGIESSKTIKSSVVTVNDAAPINAEDITVDITPVQDLHGYDRPWAGGAWKNKLVYPYTDTTKTQNNVAFTDEGNGVVDISINGTSSARTIFYIHERADNFHPPIGTYKFTKCFTNANIGVIIECYNGYAYVKNLAVSYETDEATFSVDYNGYDTISMYIEVKNGVSANSIKAKLMLRLATETDASFASYSNECPIEGRTGAELDRVGKNKLMHPFTQSFPLTFGGVTIADDNGRLTINNTSTFAFNLILVGNSAAVWGNVDNAKSLPWSDGNYTVSGGDETAKIWINQYRNGELLNAYGVGAQPITISVLSTDLFEISVRIVNGTTYRGLTISPQIEAGSTATAYEPYQGKQYTANFGETVYGGKWHVTDGGTDKTHGNIASYNGETINEPWLSSLDEYSPGATPTIGAQVVYPLTTPTTISTPKQNVPMLKGINTVSADCGETQLKYQPGNVIGELKGEIEDNIIYEDFKWTTNSSQSYSAGTPGTYGTSSWRDVKKEGYDVIGVAFVENRRFGDCILTLNYIPSTNHVEVIIFRATSSAVTIADEDIAYRVAYKKA